MESYSVQGGEKVRGSGKSVVLRNIYVYTQLHGKPTNSRCHQSGEPTDRH